MSTTQVITSLRRPFLSQLRERSKAKSITIKDINMITSQIWLIKENFDTLISEKIISPELICQFYMDYHAYEDIDERLNKVCHNFMILIVLYLNLSYRRFVE